LDDDVAARLAAEARRTGRSFKETVNAAIRGGLDASRHRPQAQRFEIRAKDLGPVRSPLQLDSVARLLEDVDGPASP
jgi:hypothetical protein